MKKILIGLLAAISLSFTPKILIKVSVAVGIVETTKAQGGAMSAGPSVFDSTYTFFQFTSPSNAPGNRWEPWKVGIYEAHLRTRRLFLDTLAIRTPGGNITGKLMWMNGAQVTGSPLSALTLSASNITGLTGSISAITGSISTNITAINTKLTASDTTGRWQPTGTYDRSSTNEIQALTLNSGSLQLSLSGGTVTLPVTDLSDYYTKIQSDATFKPINYSPSLAQIISALTYTPYNNTNPLGYISGISSSQVTTALGYMPLSAEVDGSVSNEIQSLSGSGRSFTLNNGGGSITIPRTSWDSVTSKPTTISGFGITDAQSKLSGTGFVKSTGTVVSYDNSTYLTSEIDGSVTNEIQTLSVNGQSVSISGANTVLLNNPVTFYNASGTVVAVTKVWQAIITPSTATSYTVDISSAGFSNVTNISVMAAKNTTVVSSCPNASIKAYSTSQVVINVTETNTAIVQILGINVLSGLPVVFANVSGLTIHVEVKGN